MYFTEYRGIYFVEGIPPEASVIEPFSSELNGFFSQNQLKSLDDLKEKMSLYVRSRGGNCVTDFKYGQRSTFWRSLIGMDDVLWYGSGSVATIDPADLTKYKRL